MEGKESLDLADDLAAGGIGLEHLPDPAPEVRVKVKTRSRE